MVAIFFKTYGCQANVADSQGLITYLTDLGCVIAEQEDQADLIVVNTCAIRDKAEHKMFSYLGSLAEHKIAHPHIRIGVIGCVASYRKQEIYDRFAHVNFVFGAREELGAFHAYLVDVVTQLETVKQLLLNVQPYAIPVAPQDRDIKAIVLEKNLVPITAATRRAEELHERALLERPKEVKRSFINITSGCNNYCSFCIVPFTRGREKSYSISYIINRVAREVADGAKEVTLIGQNVNSYKDPETNQAFADLLEAVAAVPGDFWVRFVSPHPKDMTRDVLEVMARHAEKLCSWIHLPLQSGSDRVLELMKRTYTAERFMEIVGWIRSTLPQAHITTDIIVGFPTETDEDYQATRGIMELVRFDLIYSFVYSPRKYTPAAKMGDPIMLEVKEERLALLQARQREIALENNTKLIGSTQRILVEKFMDEGLIEGRTSGNIRVVARGERGQVGMFVSVHIHDAGVAQLGGIVV